MQQDKIQFQIWTVPSLEGEAIESLSIRAVDQWKLGTAKEDNGLLILVAMSERQVRLEVGQGLEGSIPDVMAGRIIDYQMLPRFKNGRYFDAFQAAIQSALELHSGQTPPALESTGPSKAREAITLFLTIFLFMSIVFVQFVMRFFGLRLRAHRQGWSSPSWGGGSFGGWSGGGGGFSGGGATGRW